MPLTAAAPAHDRAARLTGARRRTAVLLVTDTAAWIGGFLTAAWTRYEFDLSADVVTNVLIAGLIASAIFLLWTTVHRHYQGRHPVGSLLEARALTGTVAATAALVLIGVFTFADRPIPASTPPVGASVALLLMLSVRAAHRDRRSRSQRPSTRSALPVLLFGLGSAGQGLLTALNSDPRSGYLPVGLLDDDPEKRHLRLDGVPVLGGRREITAAIGQTGATTLIFAIASAEPELIRQVRTATLEAGADFKVLPPVRELVDHRISVADVRDLKITDLLGRPHVVADLGTRGPELTGTPDPGDRRRWLDRLRTLPADHARQSG